MIENLKANIKRGRISGIGNKEITPEFAAKLGAAYGTHLGSKGIIVVSREFDNLSRMIKRSFIGGVMSAGLNLLNLHSAPIPVLQFFIRRFGADGGVYFSSSVKRGGESKIRFFNDAGVELEVSHVTAISEIFESNKIHRANPSDVGTLTNIPATHDIYKKAIPEFVNKEILKEAKLSVVLDCSYGTASLTMPSVLSDANIDVISINSYDNYKAPTETYPNLKSMRNCVNIVKASKADLGIVLDVDGSRALFISDTGELISFEELMMFFIHNNLNHKNPNENTIVSSYYSSNVLEKFIETEEYKLIKSKNLPGQISRKIREERAVLGGADTLKFYFPEYGPFSDATFISLKILETLAKKDVPISSLLRMYPRQILSYKSIHVPYEKLINFHDVINGRINDVDDDSLDIQDLIFGVKLIKKDLGWVKVFPSIHLDAIELSAEGKNKEDSEALIKLAEQLINKSGLMK